MTSVKFGDYIKTLRQKYKVSSRDLSASVGKAITYVSQLERGLIKKPDYSTCYKLLELLNVDIHQIDNILYNNFGITSPEREEADLNWHIKQAELAMLEQETDPVGYAEKNLHWLIDAETEGVKEKNKTLYETINILIDKDVSMADKLVNNILNLTKGKENYIFLCSLFEHDFSRFDNDAKNDVLKYLDLKSGGMQND